MSALDIAFIGLGNMGFPMAGHLARQGHRLHVYNRSQNKTQHWLHKHPGTAHNSPLEATQKAQVIIVCVGADKDVMEVACGAQGFIEGLETGSLVIDHTTTSAETAYRLDALCQKKGAEFIDAPVSGGQQGAENGQLSIMVGGTDNAALRGQEITQAYSKAFTHMGQCGSGQLTKMVNQISVAGLIQALAEGIHFAQNVGLDAEKVISVISQGAAASWQMEHRHKTMIEGHYDHGFAVDWMHKDLTICLNEAHHRQLELPITEQVKGFYEELQASDKGHWDTSALLKRLQEK